MAEFKPFEQLTQEEKDKICNGGGGKGGWVTPPHALFFEDECNHHDYGYWKGGDENQRKVCDKKFREAMVKKCSSLPWYKWLRYRPWVELYYVAVRICGSKFFNYTLI